MSFARILGALSACLALTSGAAAETGARAVAFTFDDLPATRAVSLADTREITTGILGHLERLGIPAIGFVNEVKLEVSGEKDARRALLDAWLAAGHDLGNHTYGHVRFFDTPLADYQADVLRGERVTRGLVSARGRKLLYFRHPTLNTGPDLATRRAFETFLADRGYRVAPVTVDNDEYLYAAAYDRARRRNDQALMDRLGEDYRRYMIALFPFYESLSRDLLGREIPQILLLHANALNAAYVDELAADLSGRGYRFITIDEALADPAYRLPDDYIGRTGPSWLVRWAVTRGMKTPEPPAVPEWVVSASRE